MTCIRRCSLVIRIISGKNQDFSSGFRIAKKTFSCTKNETKWDDWLIDILPCGLATSMASKITTKRPSPSKSLWDQIVAAPFVKRLEFFQNAPSSSKALSQNRAGVHQGIRFDFALLESDFISQKRRKGGEGPRENNGLLRCLSSVVIPWIYEGEKGFAGDSFLKPNLIFSPSLQATCQLIVQTHLRTSSQVRWNNPSEVDEACEDFTAVFMWRVSFLFFSQGIKESVSPLPTSPPLICSCQSNPKIKWNCCLLMADADVFR